MSLFFCLVIVLVAVSLGAFIQLRREARREREDAEERTFRRSLASLKRGIAFQEEQISGCSTTGVAIVPEAQFWGARLAQKKGITDRAIVQVGPRQWAAYRDEKMMAVFETIEAAMNAAQGTGNER